jgi:hypothetical protein
MFVEDNKNRLCILSFISAILKVAWLNLKILRGEWNWLQLKKKKKKITLD